MGNYYYQVKDCTNTINIKIELFDGFGLVNFIVKDSSTNKVRKNMSKINRLILDFTKEDLERLYNKMVKKANSIVNKG